ncbi:DUF1285 domain-containing protein [Hydrocarboniclastica marina]|uniref:DUF1285 domain-containing protein n=1 Tax=Hydrocarboniclastica marina TaxID=2259620 RepID=A0A4P7XLX5_9ALTE|nr:DUF1285 domain-containing protein [Hydrocarboniclastica marina]QCF27883.1 DUF1285 domain-containing protein [Hydrocarboniclastica marina]
MTEQAATPDRLAEQVEQELGKSRAIPPVEKWNPDFSGEMDMRIARNGDWFYQGTKLSRQSLVKLFSSILKLDDDGAYYLVTPVEKFRITVDDAPFVAHSLEREGEGPGQTLWLTTNTGDRLRVDDEHPLWVDGAGKDEPSPYIRVRRNLDALIERQTFYELASLALEGEGEHAGQLGVFSAGNFYPIGNAG